MISRTTDIAAGLAVLAIAGMFQSQSGELEGVSLLFPRMLIIFMTVGGIYLVAKGLIKGRKSSAATEDTEPVKFKRVGIISAGSVVYVLVVPLLGFYPATVLFLFGMAMVLGDSNVTTAKKAMASAFFTVVLCVAVWLGFAFLLGVPTPQSVLF
jgi:hypothetical protein